MTLKIPDVLFASVFLTTGRGWSKGCSFTETNVDPINSYREIIQQAISGDYKFIVLWIACPH